MKNVKKLFALVAVSAVFCCTAVFTACATTEHECTYGDWEETNPATCTQEGLETRVCADNPEHKQTRKTDPLGHDWGDWELTSSASCTEAGVETRTCKRDKSHTEPRAAGAATGHKWDDGKVTKPANCTEAGEKTFTCEVEGCGETKKETVSATGHKWDDGDVTKEPTETEEGLKTYTCTVSDCGETKTESISKLGHSHTYTGAWQKDADEHWKVCDGEGCDEKALTAAHDWDAGEVTTAATCSATGVKTYTCGICRATKTETVAVVATAHSWGDWTDKTAATCSAAKVQEHVCKYNPEHSETQSVGEVNPEAHNWGEWKVTDTPSDNGEGTAARTCLNAACGATAEKVLPALTTAGVYEISNDTATCEGAGTANYKYQFADGEVSFTAATAAKGHVWSAWSVTAPTDDDPGSASKQCLAEGCQGKKQTVLPALSEKDQYQYEDSSTCEMAGSEVYVFVYSDADGSEYIQVKNEEVPAKGHDFGEWTEKTPATCTAAKVEERGCSRDEEHTETREVGEPLGHAWSNTPVQDKENNTFSWTCENEGCTETNVVEYVDSGKELAAFEFGNTYYLHNSTSATKVTMYIRKSSNTGVALSKVGVYEFYFTNVGKGTLSLGTGSKLGSTRLLSNSVIADSFKDNVSFESENGQLTKLTVKVDNKVINENVQLTVGFVIDGLTSGDTGDCLIEIKYTKDAENRELDIGPNNVKVTGDISGDEYTFTSAETKEYCITVPEGMQVLMNGSEFINRGTWANFEATENEPITFTFINSTTGIHAVTIGEAKPRTFAVGGNDIRISQAGMLAETSVDKYTFTPDEDKTYSLTVPNGMTVLMNDTDLITQGTWANFTATAGEVITFTFINSEEGTFVAIIANEILPAALSVGGQAEVDMVVAIVSKIVIADDVEEGVYKLSLDGEFLIAKKTGYGQMYLMIGGDGNYETLKNSDNYVDAQTQRDENGVAIDCSKRPWTVTATLKAGDEIYIVPAISVGDYGISAGEYLTTITVTLETVTPEADAE